MQTKGIVTLGNAESITYKQLNFDLGSESQRIRTPGVRPGPCKQKGWIHQGQPAVNIESSALRNKRNENDYWREYTNSSVATSRREKSKRNETWSENPFGFISKDKLP